MGVMQRLKRFIEITSFILILGLALFLRVRGLDTTDIWSDQAFTLNTAMRWVNGGPMPLASNKSSIGTINPPLIEYLYAAALWVWPDILSVSLLTMISGMIALAAAGWSAYRVFGARVALWTALIFAVNPWSVFYSQLIWNQTMVPVFSALTLACLLLYCTVEQRAAYLILSFLWAACMTQVHPGSSAQLLAMGLVFALFWRRLRVWPLVAGAGVFVLLYVPYLLYERGVGWADVKAMLELARRQAPLSPASLLVSFDLVRAQGLFTSASYVVQFDRLATALMALSLVYAVGAVARALVRRQRDPQTVRKMAGLTVVLLWFVVPILFYLRPSHYLQIFYLIGQWPAHFILIGACLGGIQHAVERFALQIPRRAARRAVRALAWVAVPVPLLALVGWQCTFNIQFQDARLQSTGSTQVRHVRAAIQMARRLLVEHSDCDLAVVSEGHNLERSSLAPLREFTSPERVLLTDGRLAVPLPAPCALYLDALPGSRASAWLAATATPLPDMAIPVLDRTWQFYELPTELAGWEAGPTGGAVSQAHLATWTNGVALRHYAHGQVIPGATLPLTLTWAVEAQPPEVVYHIGTYLLTIDNQVIAQSDGPGFDSIQWRAGDWFITWFDVAVPQDLPPGTYQIAVALYTWPALERVNLTYGENTAFLERLQVP